MPMDMTFKFRELTEDQKYTAWSNAENLRSARDGDMFIASFYSDFCMLGELFNFPVQAWSLKVPDND